MKNNIKVKELMHLDIPLIVVELNNRGETLENIPWSDKPFVIEPYIFYEKKDGLVYAYFDKAGIKWKEDVASNFDINKLEKEIKDRWLEIKDILKEERVLQIDEFKDFLHKIQNIWTWFDCMWWMIEFQDKNGIDASRAMSLRKETEYFAPGLFSVIRKSLRNIYPELKNLVDVVTIDEFMEDVIPDKEILEKRYRGFGYISGKLYNSFEDIKSLYDIEFKVINKEVKEVKGQTAYPGKVSGTVKRLSRREDMRYFKEGQIIVASTTTPDFLPAMKIAGAIISEHGGIICHAAITSRELKIPCVVGVTGATQILKDGMEVEVDAGEGIIKIL